MKESDRNTCWQHRQHSDDTASATVIKALAKRKPCKNQSCQSHPVKVGEEHTTQQ